MSTSPGYERLHPRVQRWCFAQGWRALRDVQERAVGPILAAKGDLILAAATAAGKTEAAFLPITTHLLNEPAEGLRVLCVSPLKALINDQHRRLEELCGAAGIDVHRWHGDVGESAKCEVLEQPRGVLLITPESLEALFVLRGTRVPELFGSLAYVVVDELHAFLGTDRGRQLQSLLHRLELVARRRLPRVGLSATLGDRSLAAGFLRPEEPSRVEVIEGDAGEQRLKLRLYARDGPDAERSIAEHLLDELRGADHLVFANSRREVELFAAHLRGMCEARRVPNEFFPHHGSLSRSLREEAESALRDDSAPRTVICTSTLELGIDLGQVTSVAQLGAPPSVASLRQRLGRSGRRGGPAILRFYLRLREPAGEAPLQDRLCEELVASAAMVELLLEGWCESPAENALALSTLLQQVLSVVAQHSGATADELYGALCHRGPFAAVDASTFAALLRAMGERDLLVQESSGALLPGLAGERLIDDYHFFAVFDTPEEYRVLHGGRELGSVPLHGAVVIGSGLIFGGSYWRVTGADEARRELFVTEGQAGDPPLFSGGRGEVAGGVRQRMRGVLEEDGPRDWLDASANRLLGEARRVYRELELDRRAVVGDGGDALFLPWAGDRALRTLAVALGARGARVSQEGMALRVERSQEAELWALLGDLESDGLGEPHELAATVALRRQAKYDELLDEELSIRDYASRALDVPGALRALRAALEGASS